MNTALQITQATILLLIGVFTISSIFNAIKALVQVKKGRLDELEKKTVLDSLVYAMITLFIVHTLQFVLGIAANMIPNSGFHYRPIISSGVPYRSIISNDPWHFESLFFDCLIFSVIYFFRKRKYKE
ncbi:hypothetical protein A5821_001424 [Enterococcus sp. 7F3_DIV0205]|uniref:Uncharacterized protein n=1 Tax=Candidatus Enterococcus palustris TaxID=1834189 RepID=A0AAQ3W7W3_9ENTE|nr:hypothetical protein [Enterococcus sp. 7F3_DIV0205]OTN85822.1 hypothetical protein A5821_001768 [Enterococcus sp. 7F3_DIV0205]